MPRLRTRSQQLLPVALAATLGVSLLPTRWVTPWSSDLSQIIGLPVTPLSHAGNALRTFLRSPGPAPAPAGDEAVLADALARMEQLYDAGELRIRALEEQIEQLQRFPLAELPADVRMLTAAVIGRTPTSNTGLVELNRGSRHGVNRTAICVYGTGHLVGRITEPERLRSFMMPLTNVDSGAIRARVVAADRMLEPITSFPEVQLQPVGDGTFRADIAREHDVAEGDVVKLTDDRWPRAALARIIGLVDEIRENHDAPLREVLIVRPVYGSTDVGSVTLLIEADVAEGAPS